MMKKSIVKKSALLLAVIGLVTLLYTALDGVKTSSSLENLSYAVVFLGIAVFFLIKEQNNNDTA